MFKRFGENISKVPYHKANWAKASSTRDYNRRRPPSMVNRDAMRPRIKGFFDNWRGSATIATIGLAGAAGVSAVKGTERLRQGINRGLFPGNAYPSEAGRFGIRTNTSPAGLSGVRFNYRRS